MFYLPMAISFLLKIILICLIFSALNANLLSFSQLLAVCYLPVFFLIIYYLGFTFKSVNLELLSK